MEKIGGGVLSGRDRNAGEGGERENNTQDGWKSQKEPKIIIFDGEAFKFQPQFLSPKTGINFHSTEIWNWHVRISKELAMNPRHPEIICLSVQRRENSSWSPSFMVLRETSLGKEREQSWKRRGSWWELRLKRTRRLIPNNEHTPLVVQARFNVLSYNCWP